MIILKVTKNQSFTLSLEDTFSKKKAGQGQIDPTAILGLTFFDFMILILIVICNHVNHKAFDRVNIRKALKTYL